MTDVQWIEKQNNLLKPPQGGAISTCSVENNWNASLTVSSSWITQMTCCAFGVNKDGCFETTGK